MNAILYHLLFQLELNPLENAIESLLSKNRELTELIVEHENNPTMNVSPLSMILKGVIDANVNGGISNYQRVSCPKAYYSVFIMISLSCSRCPTNIQNEMSYEYLK